MPRAAAKGERVYLARLARFLKVPFRRVSAGLRFFGPRQVPGALVVRVGVLAIAVVLGEWVHEPCARLAGAASA